MNFIFSTILYFKMLRRGTMLSAVSVRCTSNVPQFKTLHSACRQKCKQPVVATWYVTLYAMQQQFIECTVLYTTWCMLCSSNTFGVRYYVICTLFSVLCTRYAAAIHLWVLPVCEYYYVLCTVFSVLCTQYSVLCTMYSIHCTLYLVLYTLYCTLYSVLISLYTLTLC